jgi:phosphotransferase system IIB component
MDAHEYRLKEKQANGVDSIASCIDDLRSDLNHNSEVNSKRIDSGLGDVCTFIEALTSQIVVLNKNMERIANSMGANKVRSKNERES